MNVKREVEEKMKKAIDHLKDDLKGLRTGRANPAMVETVLVEVYGTQMRIRDMAQVTTPDSRQLLITPFDPSNIAAIEEGIKRANLGFMPNVDGHIIRINVPSMDASIRDQMVKKCHDLKEKAKVNIRNTRKTANNDVRKQKSDGDIGEDILKKTEKEVQELTDKFCKEVDEICAVKEKEILTI